MRKINLKKMRWKFQMPKCFTSFSGLSLKSKVGRSVLVVIPLLLATAGATLGITLHNKKSEPSKVVDVVTNKVNRRIYLISSDDVTIPISVQIEKKNTISEDIVEVFNLLKVDSKVSTQSIKGYIPTSTKLKNIEIVDNKLLLNVSKEFLDYDVKSERRMIESIAYTFTQFEGVNKVNLFVDGEYLKALPKHNTKIPGVLSTSIGINVKDDEVSKINKNTLNIYFQKEYDSKQYLIPISQIVDVSTTIEGQLASAIKSSSSLKNGMTRLPMYDSISLIQKDTDEKNINLDIKETGLIEEGLVNKELFNLVSLTLYDAKNTLPVTFKIEGESLAVEGLLNYEEFKVSELIFNEVKL